MKRTRLINKKLKKLVDGKCKFCDCSEYELLDTHRIVPGEDGGTYTDFNTVTTCANCHRKIHAGKIKILGKHFSTTGGYLINYINEDGREMWI